jgi:NifU-like protein involved in Fe-S cluster formation
MDQGVINYYRKLLREDFPNSGAMDRPAIFVEAIGEKLINCGNTGNYMQLYLQVDAQKILEIKYLCSCEPVANVAVEVLCILVKGMKLAEAENLTEKPFFYLIDSQDEGLHNKIMGLLEMLKKGIEQYHTKLNGKVVMTGDGDGKREMTNWDETQSI